MKKVISIILVLTICMATYTSVAFADAELLVTSDYPETQAEEIIENNDDANLEDIQGTVEIDDTVVIPNVSEILEAPNENESEEIDETEADVTDEVNSEEPEDSEIITDNIVEPDAQDPEENESENTDISDNTENNNEIIDNDSEETEDPETTDDEHEDESEGVEELDNNEENDNENSEQTSDEPNEPVDSEEDGKSETTEETPVEEKQSEEKPADSELQSELDKIKEYMEPTEDEILSSIEVVVPGRPETVSGNRMDFFSVYDSEQEELKYFINTLYGEKSDLTFSYLFLGDKMPFISNSEKVVTYVHNFNLSLKNHEALIALYDSMVEDEVFETEIDIIYSGSDSESLYFKASDGSRVELSKVSYFGDEGKKIARIRLTNDILSSIAYFRNSYCGVEVFKLVGATDDSDITIHEINVSSVKNSYVVIRGMDEDCHFEDPAVGLSITSTDGEYIGVLFASQNGLITISGSSNSVIEVMEGFEHSHVLISTELDKQIFDVYIPSDDPQTVIEKTLNEGNEKLPENLDPKLDPATKPEDENEDEEGKSEDDEETEDGPDPENVATDTDLRAERPEYDDEITEFEMEEIPDATPIEIVVTDDAQEVPAVVEELSEEQIESEDTQIVADADEISEDADEETEEAEEQTEVSDADEIAEEESEEEKEEEEVQKAAEEQQAEAEEQGQETEPEPEQAGTEPEPETVDEAPADADLIPEDASPIVEDASPVIDDASPISDLGFADTVVESYADTTVVNF